MIGHGPLLDACHDLAQGLAIRHAVTFLGAQPQTVISEELRNARAFVQHSVEAPSGDCEGTPVAVLEAGASGLPVVATRHAGIPDVVIEGETGLLVDERDVEGMATQMLRLLREPLFAARLGDTARSHIRTNFSMRQSLDRLWAVIEPALSPDRLSDKKSRSQSRPVGKSTVLSSCHSEGQK
jgi:glycosyltransferase involved in cell wall biosynthesis